MSIITRAEENARQEIADDKNFWHSMVYFFELRLPSKAVTGGLATELLFPLILNPQSIQTLDPFTMAETPTSEGGLFVEENGIIRRPIRITGTTGWKPKSFPHTFAAGKLGPASSDLVKVDRFSFHRRGNTLGSKFSGQRHFQFLQDRVFRTYGDLKRSPDTAKDTLLIWHNPKDDEHWIVAPKAFQLDRDVRSRVQYRYTIDLVIIGRAADTEITVSEDRGLLESLRDVVQSARDFVDNVLAVVTDLQSTINDWSRFASATFGLIGKLSTAMNVVSNFASGVADSVLRPFETLESVMIDLASARDQIGELDDILGVRVVDRLDNSFRRAEQAFDYLLGFSPEIFRPTEEDRELVATSRTAISTSYSSSALAAAEANPPANVRDFGRLGSAPMPGDLARSRAEHLTPSSSQRGSVQHRLGPNERLPDVARRFLGSSRRWPEIARLNNLRAPYVSASGLPGTLRPGDTILVPARQQTASVSALATVVARPGTPLEERLFGRDWLLKRDFVSGLFDKVVDVTGTDAKTVAGVDNLGQALMLRVETERGQSPHYRAVGRRRIEGLGFSPVDDEIIRIRLTEAVTADPRVLTVSRVDLNRDQVDSIEADIDVVPRGLQDSLTVETSFSLPA